MSIKEKAVELHDNGYNCAQSVLAASREYTGLDDNTALAISAGFGGGLRSGEVCGAISGAVMAVGMKYPFIDANDAEAKARIAELAKECVAIAQEKYGCVACRELKGSNGVSCNEIIAFMADVAEELMNK